MWVKSPSAGPHVCFCNTVPSGLRFARPHRYGTLTAPATLSLSFAATWNGAEDGSGAARIEEEVVVTKDGCQIITNFPSDRLISCGLPGCEVF